MSESVERTRNFATVVYPESAPDHWLDILHDLHIPCFVSPLHNNDFDAKGKPKKPHYHVQFMFDNVKTRKQAQEVISKINGVGCENLNSVRAYARYLCHLDDYDKQLYDTGQVIQFGGANYSDIIGSPSDKLMILREMKKFVKENYIFYYCDLVDYAEENNSMWFDCLANSGSYFMKEYIKSFAYKYEREKAEKSDQ